jgi:hypothetical protein
LQALQDDIKKMEFQLKKAKEKKKRLQYALGSTSTKTRKQYCCEWVGVDRLCYSPQSTVEQFV